MEENKVIPIQDMILEIRGQKVMLDSDLARLYEVEVKVLNQAVKRNITRFPEDFMFQLSQSEWSNLRSQIAISSSRLQKQEKEDLRSQFVTSSLIPQKQESENLRSQNGISSSEHGGRRFAPYVFTEQGVAMLSSVLNSERAIGININIMRTFVKLRHFALSQGGSSEQITELRRLLMLHIDHMDYKFTEHDEAINEIIDALNNLIEKPAETRRIGFCVD